MPNQMASSPFNLDAMPSMQEMDQFLSEFPEGLDLDNLLDDEIVDEEKSFNLEKLDAKFSLDNIRKWLDEVRLVCPSDMLVAFDNMAFDHMLFWNMIRELQQMQKGIVMKNRADFVDTFSVMNHSWMKEYASKFFKEHKKAYCFFAAEAEKRGFFKLADGPWGVMKEFGTCSEAKKAQE